MIIFIFHHNSLNNCILFSSLSPTGQLLIFHLKYGPFATILSRSIQYNIHQIRPSWTPLQSYKYSMKSFLPDSPSIGQLYTEIGQSDLPSNIINHHNRPPFQSIKPMFCSKYSLNNQRFHQPSNLSFSLENHRSILRCSRRPSALHSDKPAPCHYLLSLIHQYPHSGFRYLIFPYYPRLQRNSLEIHRDFTKFRRPIRNQRYHVGNTSINAYNSSESSLFDTTSGNALFSTLSVIFEIHLLCLHPYPILIRFLDRG